MDQHFSGIVLDRQSGKVSQDNPQGREVQGKFQEKL